MVTTRERLTGCLLGGAIGDALGAPIEFMSLSQIRREYGKPGLTDYDRAYGRFGAVTDDSQMTLFSVEGLVMAAKHQDVDVIPSLYRAYRRWLYTQGHDVRGEQDDLVEGWLLSQPDESFIWDSRGPGSTCQGGLAQGRIGTEKHPLNQGKGCGVVMRSAPFGFLDHLTLDEVYELALDAGYLSHGHPSACHSGAALAKIIRQVVGGVELRAAALIAMHSEPDPDTKRALAAALGAAKTDPPSPQAVERLGEGWEGAEALSMSLYAALVHENDPVKALLLAVNHGGDSDSTGAICGNLVGAVHGLGVWPEIWINTNEATDVILDAVDRFAEVVLLQQV